MALLDWLLPGLDGIDICRRIRKLGNGTYIYTVMLTSKNRKQDLLMAMEAGADDYLPSPSIPPNYEPASSRASASWNSSSLCDSPPRTIS